MVKALCFPMHILIILKKSNTENGNQKHLEKDFSPGKD